MFKLLLLSIVVRSILPHFKKQITETAKIMRLFRQRKEAENVSNAKEKESIGSIKNRKREHCVASLREMHTTGLLDLSIRRKNEKLGTIYKECEDMCSSWCHFDTPQERMVQDDKQSLGIHDSFLIKRARDLQILFQNHCPAYSGTGTPFQ